MIQEGSVAGNIVVNAFLFAVALAVAAVPEGLPATITVTLAIGVQRLVKKNVIIKKLNAVETLGSTSVICSDKTGTLTKNEMTVKEIFLSNDFIQVSGVGYIPEGQFIKNQSLIQPEKDHNLMHLLTIATACNNANIIKEDGHHLITGDPTEAALLVAAKKTGIDRHHLEDTMPRLHEFPFDSTRKMMSTIIKQKNSQLVCVKGAPDEILKKCRKIVIQNSIIHLTEQRKRQIVVAIEDTREIRLHHENWLPAVARTGFGGTKTGEVTMFDLLKESFRQNPNYIIVGEVRGEEAAVMFQAMASGMTAMSTMHAGSADDALKRLMTRPISLPPTLMETLDILIVMTHAYERGASARRIKEIVEIDHVDSKTECSCRHLSVSIPTLLKTASPLAKPNMVAFCWHWNSFLP